MSTWSFAACKDPIHGYKFRSKKEVSRYLQTGDASSCARRPAKRNVASTTKDNSPTTDDASLKKLGCFMTGRQLFATANSKGGKSFGTCSPAQQVESSKKQPDCSVSDPNAIITSILTVVRISFEDAEIETQSRKSRNTESINLGRRVSKRLAGQNPEAAADLDLGERALPAVVDKSASPSLSVNVYGQELLQDSNPTPETGNSDQASLNGEASLDGLPPGWKKLSHKKKARGIRKDPVIHEKGCVMLAGVGASYVKNAAQPTCIFSKKDVFRYLQTGAISSCAIKPAKRDLDATMKESSGLHLRQTCFHSLLVRHSRSSKNFGEVVPSVKLCFRRQGGKACAPSQMDFVVDRTTYIELIEKRSVTCSPEVQAESSKKQPESGVSNANTIITSFAADMNAKHSNENADVLFELWLRNLLRWATLNAFSEEFSQNKDPNRKVGTGNSHQASLSREAGDGVQAWKRKYLPRTKIRQLGKKEILAQNKINRGTGNSDPGFSDREAKGMNYCQAWKRKLLLKNKDSTVGTGFSEQRSFREGDVLPDLGKEILAQNKDPTAGTGNSDQASPKRSFREGSIARLGKEILAQNKDPTFRAGNSDQASLSREASGKEVLPDLGKEILAQNKNPTVGTGNSDQASPSREAGG
ncbi:hypothetical protein HAX54_041339 [Datura stramonium]|uniref:MBD domain-containing protein n=1 Tax=Datura stramonium TaxID=4076 RepID=A0ABS8SL21_DATST|nr:hypothetical protein [Datura stramonium]